MRLVIRVNITDRYTYFVDTFVPVVYESAEAFLVDFESFCKKNQNSFSLKGHEFAGQMWDVSNFFEDGKYFDPTVMTVDEWFAKVDPVS